MVKNIHLPIHLRTLSARSKGNWACITQDQAEKVKNFNTTTREITYFAKPTIELPSHMQENLLIKMKINALRKKKVIV